MSSLQNPMRSYGKERGRLGLKFSLMTRVFSCGGDVGDDDQAYSFTHLCSLL
jgi:hypothetical protein